MQTATCAVPAHSPSAYLFSIANTRDIRNWASNGIHATKREYFARIVKERSAATVDGVFVDLRSASLVTQVLDSLSPANRSKLLSMDTEKMVRVCFNLVAKLQGTKA